MTALISYSRPTIDTVTIGGTGATIDTDEDNLFSGRPGETTRFSWLSASGQTTSDSLTLDLEWTGGSNIRMVGIIGITLDHGTRVRLQVEDSSGWVDPSGHFDDRVTTFPDGSKGVWFLMDDPGDITKLRIEAFNDVDGSPDITSSSEFEIGEIWLGPVVEVEIDAGTQEAQVDDMSVFNISLDQQVWVVERESPRIYSPTLKTDTLDDITGEGLANSMDWEKVAYNLRGAPGAFAPRWKAEGGTTLDADTLQRYAIFGFLQPGSFAWSHLTADIYTARWIFREVPA